MAIQGGRQNSDSLFIACYDAVAYTEPWWYYCEYNFKRLLVVPDNKLAILLIELTKLPMFLTVGFTVVREYQGLCLSFRLGTPSQLYPVIMIDMSALDQPQLSKQTPSRSTSRMRRSSSSATKMSSFTIFQADLNKLTFSQTPTVPRQQPVATAAGSLVMGAPKDFIVVHPGAKKHVKRQRQLSGGNAMTASEEAVDPLMQA